jgi:hypothetical protein
LLGLAIICVPFGETGVEPMVALLAELPADDVDGELRLTPLLVLPPDDVDGALRLTALPVLPPDEVDGALRLMALPVLPELLRRLPAGAVALGALSCCPFWTRRASRLMFLFLLARDGMVRPGGTAR